MRGRNPQRHIRSRSILINIFTYFGAAFSETTEQRSVQKFGVGKLFNESSPGMDLFDQKYSKNCEILLQFKIAVFYVNIC